MDVPPLQQATTHTSGFRMWAYLLLAVHLQALARIKYLPDMRQGFEQGKFDSNIWTNRRVKGGCATAPQTAKS